MVKPKKKRRRTENKARKIILNINIILMVRKLPLTDKEEQVLAYIYGYIDENGYSPTRKEIADKFEITRQGAESFISNLELKGKIRIIKANFARNIKIVIHKK